jgi:hypothetical protein
MHTYISLCNGFISCIFSEGAWDVCELSPRLGVFKRRSNFGSSYRWVTAALKLSTTTTPLLNSNVLCSILVFEEPNELIHDLISNIDAYFQRKQYSFQVNFEGLATGTWVPFHIARAVADPLSSPRAIRELGLLFQVCHFGIHSTMPSPKWESSCHRGAYINWLATGDANFSTP